MTSMAYFCAVGAFVLGYVLGRVNWLAAYAGVQPAAAAPVGFFAQQKTAPAARRPVPDIDSRTVVVPISTAGMARDATTALGKTTTTADDIQASVSKLAQLKGR